MARRARPWFRVNRGWFVTLDGKQVSLGVSDPNGEEAAVAAFKQLLARMREPAAAATVADVVAAYLARAAARVKPKTLAYYERYLADLTREFGHRDLGSLLPAEVEDAAARRFPTPRGRRNFLATVDACLRQRRADWRTEKPTRRRQPEAVAPETYWQLRAAGRHDFRALLDVLWHTGARPSEVLGLTVEGVDWAGSLARLADHKTDATGRMRVVHFNAQAMRVLEAQRAKYGSGLLFRNEAGKPLTAYQAGRRMWLVCQRRGLKATLYGFRHSFITRALVAGVPPAHVAELVGHANTATLFRFYSHLGEHGATLKASLDRIA